MYKLKTLLLCLFIFHINIVDANAYIGPGMAGGVIAATIGIILAIFSLIFGILWFPIKRYLNSKKKKNENNKK